MYANDAAARSIAKNVPKAISIGCTPPDVTGLVNHRDPSVSTSNTPAIKMMHSSTRIREEVVGIGTVVPAGSLAGSQRRLKRILRGTPLLSAKAVARRPRNGRLTNRGRER